MKKVIFTSIVVLGTAVTSLALLPSNSSTKTEAKKLIKPCRSQPHVCPSGAYVEKCSRNAGTQTPFCDQYEEIGQNPMDPCAVVQPCRE